jgi:hypothetical protein
MGDFKKFFYQKDVDKTPNTSHHHHSMKRMTNMGDRKGLNFVADSEKKKSKINPKVKDALGGIKRFVTPEHAQALASDHGFTLENLPKQLNSKWKNLTLNFDTKTGRYYLKGK